MSHVAFFGPFFSDSFSIFAVIIKFRRPVIINFCAICRSFLQGTYFAKNLSMKQTEKEDKTSFASQKTFCFVLFSFGRTTREHLTPVLLLSGRLTSCEDCLRSLKRSPAGTGQEEEVFPSTGPSSSIERQTK